MSKFNDKLMRVKSDLVQVLSCYPYEGIDGEQLEYLIQLVDWMILGKIEVDKVNIQTLMEEIIGTSVNQLNLQLLDTLHDLGDIQKELYGNEIQL